MELVEEQIELPIEIGLDQCLSGDIHTLRVGVAHVEGHRSGDRRCTQWLGALLRGFRQKTVAGARTGEESLALGRRRTSDLPEHRYVLARPQLRQIVGNQLTDAPGGRR